MKQMLVVWIVLGLSMGIVNAQEITVVTEEFPPYNYTDNGELTGFATEIVKASLAKARIQAEIKVYPWARAYRMALEKENVLIYSIRRSKEREELFKWVCPITPPPDVFLYKLKERTDLVVNSLDDVKQYTVGAVRDDWVQQLLVDKGFEKGENIDIVSDDSLNIKKLLRKRIDFIGGPELVLAKRMKDLGISFSQVEKAFTLYKGDAQSCMAFSKSTPDEIVERVSAGLEEVRAEGLIESVMEKYLQMFQ